MKKENIVRMLFICLVLTLASACMVGGTLAQYISYDQGYDIVYIAEWGVTVAVSGQTYEIDGVVYEESLMYSDSNSVSMTSSTSVIAPGSSGYYTFGWTGSPQVDVYISVADYVVTDDTQVAEEMMEYGSDDDSTSDESEATSTTTTIYSQYEGSWYGADALAYYPVEWGLFVLDDDTEIDDLYTDEYFYGDANLVGDFYSSEINNVYYDEEAVSVDSTSYDDLLYTLYRMYYFYEAGTTIDQQYVVVWQWPFGNVYSENNADDTFLGDIYQYVGNYLVTGVYSVGDIISSDEYYDAGEAGCDSESAFYVMSDNYGYSAGDIISWSVMVENDISCATALIVTDPQDTGLSVGDVIAWGVAYNYWGDSCDLYCDYAYIITSEPENRIDVGEAGSFITDYTDHSGYYAVEVQVPCIVVAITVTVQQASGENIADSESTI